nr:MAG TPA: hypothetical protein [Caudoviricetes sp.]DAN67565.1 MAG TPA: hypothetical protein [Caudoviricetes sp.]
MHLRGVRFYFIRSSSEFKMNFSVVHRRPAPRTTQHTNILR